MKLVGSREAVRTPQFHKKKVVQSRLRTTLVIVVLLLVFVAPVFVLQSEKLLISDVDISGNNVTKSEDIEQIVKSSLSGKYLWLIPKSNAFIYPDEEIEQELLRAIPRLSFASVSLSGTKALEVVVSERVPSALYCQNISDNQNPSECFFLDGSGYIFSIAPDFSGGVYTIYSAEPLIDEPLQKQFLAEEEFKRLSKFTKDLPLINIEPKAVIRKDDEYSIRLSGGTEMRIKRDQNLENLYTDLDSFLRGAKFKTADIKRLLYIDLRFDNKVFYRFRGE